MLVVNSLEHTQAIPGYLLIVGSIMHQDIFKQYTIIDFIFSRHEDLSTWKSDIHRGLETLVNITYKGR